MPEAPAPPTSWIDTATVDTPEASSGPEASGSGSLAPPEIANSAFWFMDLHTKRYRAMWIRQRDGRVVEKRVSPRQALNMF